MLMRPGNSLTQRVVHAGFWALGLRITLRVLGTIRIIVLARLLAPADFGLMGIAMIMMAMLETFTETGFWAALVQRRGDIRPYLDTAWTVQVVRGLLTAGLLALAAPLLAAFFDAPGAITIIRVMAIVAFIKGLNNIGIVYFHKDLEFQKRFLFEVANVIPQVAVGIGLAIALQSVWALVFGSLAGALTGMVASYVLHPYRPRLRLEWTKARELYGFGKWVFTHNILIYLARHLDDNPDISADDITWQEYERQICPPEIILAALQDLEERHGGIVGYAHAIGLSDAEIESIREAMVE